MVIIFRIRNCYKSNENNSVDLIYNFKLGEIAKIKKLIL